MLKVNFKVHKWRVKINILMLKSRGSIQTNLGETQGENWQNQEKEMRLDENRYDCLSNHIWLRDLASFS